MNLYLYVLKKASGVSQSTIWCWLANFMFVNRHREIDKLNIVLFCSQWHIQIRNQREYIEIYLVSVLVITFQKLKNERKYLVRKIRFNSHYLIQFSSQIINKAEHHLCLNDSSIFCILYDNWLIILYSVIFIIFHKPTIPLLPNEFSTTEP